MKFLLLSFFIALFSGLCFAQGASVETDFAKNKKRFIVEKYAMGEDASSGYDYLIYKDKADIVKIRTIWNGGASSAPTVEDVYYKAGAPLMYAKLALTKKQFKSAVRGNEIALFAVEKLYFKDSKLVKWIENGKTVANDDSRWQEKEKEALEIAKQPLEFYPTLKELQ